MPRTPTLENPFAPEKHRSTDDAKFVGDVLGKDAEAAMRRTVADKSEGADNADTQGDLALTPDEQTQIEEEGRKKRGREKSWTYAQVVAWAEALDKNEDWVNQTFTFQSDGSLIAVRSIDCASAASPCDCLPQGLTEIRGDLYLHTLTSAEHLTLPASIHGSLFLNSLTSGEHLLLPSFVSGDVILTKLPDAEKNKLRKKYPNLRIL